MIHLLIVSITGGVLIFAVNSLLYLNQSVPPYGVSLNSIASTCSAFPLRKYSCSITVLQRFCFVNTFPAIQHFSCALSTAHVVL